MTVFPLFYAGNVSYYRALLRADAICFERHEFFPKQTYRNRIEVLGPNGVQKLVIPTLKTGAQRTMANVRISYAENWQKDHWKSLEAAYRRSPYFEFYEVQLRPFYQSQHAELLWDFNWNIHSLLTQLINIDLSSSTTDAYDTDLASHKDQRFNAFKQPEKYPAYLQVFSDRHAFHPNLSIFDMLFNLGPQTKPFLLK